MTWVKLDDGTPLHPKILSLSDGAFRLWINGLAFANRATTDGEIDGALVQTLDHRRAWSDRQIRGFAAELERAGLWIRDGKSGKTGEKSVPSVKIHQYAEYQEEALKDSVEERRRAARERKREQRKREKQGKSPPRHAVTPRDIERDTERDKSRPVTRESQPPVPSRPVPSSTTDVVERATSTLLHSDELARIAEGSYQRAVEGTGGIYDHAPKWRQDFVSAGRLAERHVERHGGDVRSTLEAWAKRYVAERQKRRPDWWLERCTAWAGSDTERGAATDELARLRAELDALEPARNEATIAGPRGLKRLKQIEAQQNAIRKQIQALKSATGAQQRRAS